MLQSLRKDCATSDVTFDETLDDALRREGVLLKFNFAVDNESVWLHEDLARLRGG